MNTQDAFDQLTEEQKYAVCRILSLPAVILYIENCIDESHRQRLRMSTPDVGDAAACQQYVAEMQNVRAFETALRAFLQPIQTCVSNQFKEQ